MITIRPSRAVALLSSAAVMIGMAHAQEQLEARVVRADGSGLSNVQVEAENLSTGATFQGVSDAQGRIRFGILPTGGPYRLTTDAVGEYGAVTSDPFTLRSGFDESVILQVFPASSDVIEVRGARTVSGLNRSNAEVSATLSAAEIDTIPVEARSLERLLFRLPAVTQSTGFFPEAPAVSVNGANALFTNYTIDGLDNNENFLGGQRFPLTTGAIQDVTVLSGSYSVEYGRTANGVVNVTTPSGGNELKGEVFFLSRPADFLQADPASTRTSLFGAPVSDSFSRNQGGGSLSGPIVEDQTFFFLNAEYVRDETENLLSVPALDVAETLEGTNAQFLLTARVDHVWNDRFRSALRLNHGRVELENPGGGLTGGVTFPSAGATQDRFSTNLALINTYTHDLFDYVGTLQYSRFGWDYGEPANGAGPQVTLFEEGALATPVGVIGHPGFVFDETENTIQTQHKVTWQHGAHRFKAGFDLLTADFELKGGGNPDGNFTVALTADQLAALSGFGAGLDPADLPSDVDVLGGTIETQPAEYGERQTLVALYLEDQWQATPELSFTLGLRYDYDSLTGIVGDADTDNFAPRFAFNYSPRPDIAIRGGLGLYVEKIPYAIISDAIQQSARTPVFLGQLQDLINQGILPPTTDVNEITTDRGNAAVSVFDSEGMLLCPAITDCPDPATFAGARDDLTFTERRIFNPEGLDNPEATQASLGFEWQFTDKFYFGVDAQYTEGRNLVRLVDLNAPEPFVFDEAAFRAGADPATLIRTAAEADATRPTLPEGGVRSIVVSDTGGRSEYAALIFKVRKDRGDDFYDGSIFYTLSRLENDTDDINFRANDANDFDADFGPSLNDRTHVISSLVNVYPIENFSLNLAVLLQSGQPINFVPDPDVFGTTDINGDGLSFADQFTGNPDRYPLVDGNSGRLDWASTVDLGAQYRFTDVGPGQIDVRADLFNVFNEETQTGFPVNFTASNQVQTFGQDVVIRSVGQPRTFQFSVRYAF